MTERAESLAQGISRSQLLRIARYNDESGKTTGENQLADQESNDKLYKAEYLGSGTFVISKPKRKKAKTRQSQLKNPQRGARK